ncbi:MAG: hypothetical protein IPI54_07000 [Chitinophagaceae bacterium]|nr:hypothetical protein [Chitinophagaceae bacterium]
MKHVSIFKATALFLAVIVISASVIQCRKTGDVIKGLDRSFTEMRTQRSMPHFMNPIR